MASLARRSEELTQAWSSLNGDAWQLEVIEATSRDLLAVLLGRSFHTPPRFSGDTAFGHAFSRAFPGP